MSWTPPRPGVIAVTLAAGLVAVAVSVRADGADPGGGRPPVAAGPSPAFALAPPGRLARRSAALGTGPRLLTASVRGRPLVMYGAARAGRRMLVAGCANGRRCAGEQVTAALRDGCPPPDAELWIVPTLRPAGTDADADPSGVPAAAWCRAAADLRPHVAVVLRTGPRAVVHAAGPSTGTGRRFARRAGLAFEPGRRHGLAAWTTAVLPGARAVAVELPRGRLLPAAASRIAYAIERLAGTRFARGAHLDRLRLARHGVDAGRGRG